MLDVIDDPSFLNRHGADDEGVRGLSRRRVGEGDHVETCVL